jgi:hypothetical protein
METTSILKVLRLIVVMITVWCGHLSAWSLRTGGNSTAPTSSTLRALSNSQLPAETSLSSNCNPFHHNTMEVKESVDAAWRSLSRFSNDVPISSRLATMILFSRGFTANSHMSSRLDYLRCALLKLQKQVMQHTTMDVFIWALNSTDSPIVLPSWLNDKDFPRVHVLAIPEKVWRVPCGLIPDSEWLLRKHFNVDYYLMGRWRLTFSFDFAHAMGYEYHLQFDDDAMVNKELPFNITARMDAQKYQAAVFSDVIYEIPQATLGLSELTAYWLKIAHYVPRGPIFKHTSPQDIKGLTSDGYDRAYSPGYFMLFRVSWWYTAHVQDYLQLVLRSGRDVEGRWQEQAVMNMMIYIFITEGERWVIQELDLGHDRHKRAFFEEWCVKSGILTNNA